MGKGGSATEQTTVVLIRLLFLESVLRYFLIVILLPFVEGLCLVTPPDTLTTILALSRYLLLPRQREKIHI